MADLSAKLDETAASLEAMTSAKADADAQIATLTSELTSTGNELATTTATLNEAQSTMMELLSRNAIAQGFNGPVTVSAIINTQGAIAYLTVDAAGETAGLGQKVMDTEYLVQFLGKRLPLTLGKDVDAVAGATITSQAVVDALNLLATDYDNQADPSSFDIRRAVTKEVAYIQKVPGYNSTLTVIVYVTPSGTVTNVDVTADGEGNGQNVMDKTFTNQFVGVNTNVTLGVDVDAVAGATATCQAVVDAVNNITK